MGGQRSQELGRSMILQSDDRAASSDRRLKPPSHALSACHVVTSWVANVANDGERMSGQKTHHQTKVKIHRAD